MMRGWMGSHQRRSEEHTSELQSLRHLVCRLLLEKKKKKPRLHPATNNWTTYHVISPTVDTRSRNSPRAKSVSLASIPYMFVFSFFFFFFNDTATTEIYTLSLHDALPISSRRHLHRGHEARQACDHAQAH